MPSKWHHACELCCRCCYSKTKMCRLQSIKLSLILVQWWGDQVLYQLLSNNRGSVLWHHQGSKRKLPRFKLFLITGSGSNSSIMALWKNEILNWVCGCCYYCLVLWYNALCNMILCCFSHSVFTWSVWSSEKSCSCIYSMYVCMGWVYIMD